MAEDGLTIMLVEDSLPIRQRIRETIEAIGGVRVVAEVATGEDAVARDADLQPAVVILDLSLAGTLTGFDVLRTIRKREPRRRILIMSNSSSQAHRAACLRFGADHFLDKTAEFEQLSTWLRAQLSATL